MVAAGGRWCAVLDWVVGLVVGLGRLANGGIVVCQPRELNGDYIKVCSVEIVFNSSSRKSLLFLY